MWRIPSIFCVFCAFCRFCCPFLDVECDGEEGKVHCDLVFPEVSESPAAALPVLFLQARQIQTLNNRVQQANGVVLGNILVDSLRKKNRLVVYVRAKV